MWFCCIYAFKCFLYVNYFPPWLCLELLQSNRRPHTPPSRLHVGIGRRVRRLNFPLHQLGETVICSPRQNHVFMLKVFTFPASAFYQLTAERWQTVHDSLLFWLDALPQVTTGSKSDTVAGALNSLLRNKTCFHDHSLLILVIWFAFSVQFGLRLVQMSWLFKQRSQR